MRANSLGFLALALALSTTAVQAQVKGPIERYSATTANVNGAGEPVTIELLKWSTDADRDRLASVLAWYGEKEVAGAMPTVGYLWTSASAGYSIRYAYRIQGADGGQRIILLTDRKLGAWSPEAWKPTAATATPDPNSFSVIELRVNRAGQGEGKTSLTTKVTFEAATKSIVLENYAAQPVILKGVAKK
jgi:hypothetical protein